MPGALFVVSFICWLVWGGGWWLFFTIIFGLAWLGNTKSVKDAKNTAGESNSTADPVVVAALERSAQEPRHDGSRWRTKMSEVCSRYSGQDYYQGELVPIRKLTKDIPFPGGGSVMALIDCTLSGSADDGVKIGLEGIGWRTMSEPNSLCWGKISPSSIVPKGISGIALGAEGELNLAGSAFPRDNALMLLRELTEAYGYNGPDAQPITQKEISLIDVNVASYKELLTLPGIGPAEAALILKCRVDTGAPYSLEELAALLQLKPHIVERLRGKVTFSKRNPGLPPKAEKRPEPPQSPKDERPGPRGGGREID